MIGAPTEDAETTQRLLMYIHTLMIGVHNSTKKQERLLSDIKYWLQFCAGMLLLIAIYLKWGR